MKIRYEKYAQKTYIYIYNLCLTYFEHSQFVRYLLALPGILIVHISVNSDSKRKK